MQRVAIIACLTLLTACDVTPAGRQQLTLLPPAYMDDMGREAFSSMKLSEPVEQNPSTNRYVQCIADHITRTAPGLYPGYVGNADWEVVVFDDPSANAFAMPGYKIGVFTGLIDLAEDDDQLAAVIGHEVGHVLSNHGNERMTQAMGINIVLLLIGLFTEIDSQLALQALGLGAEVGVMLPFSRVHESEADVIGLQLMAAAGFRPEASVELWQNMSEAAGSTPFEFLSTHPGHDTRIKKLKDNLEVARAMRGPAVDCN